MKKGILIIGLFFIGIIGINAKTIEVQFSKCIDGDTAKFIYKDEEITTRFLAIDTPETVHPTKEVEAYGKEASEYTCNKIKNTKKIKLEYDESSEKLDKYDRHLVWVFIDDVLLQKKLVSKGYASVAYLYGDYKYTEELEKVEQEAKNQKLGIWSLEEYKEKNIETEETLKKEDSVKTAEDYKQLIILLGIVIMLCLFSTKARKKVKNKAKKELIKELKKRFK